MALKSVSVGSISNVSNSFTVAASTANTVIYVVPAGKYFEGFVIGNSNSVTADIKVNGVEVARFDRNNTYFSEAYPVYFMEGDIVSTKVNNFYFTLTGVERSL